MLIGYSKYFFFSVSIRPHLFVLFKLNDTQVHTKSYPCQRFLLGPLVLFDFIVLALQPFLPECLPSKETGGKPKIQSPVDVLVFLWDYTICIEAINKLCTLQALTCVSLLLLASY